VPYPRSGGHDRDVGQDAVSVLRPASRGSRRTLSCERVPTNRPRGGIRVLKRSIRTVIGVCVAVVVAGCGSAVATPSVSVTAPFAGPSTSAAPIPTPAASMSITDLGKAYVACADATNAEGSRLNAQLDQLGTVTATTLAAWKTLVGKFAGLEATFRFCFTGIPWPPQLGSDVQQLLAAGMATEDIYGGAVRATTPAQLMDFASRIRAAQIADAAAARRIRNDLGLPPPSPDSPVASAPSA